MKCKLSIISCLLIAVAAGLTSCQTDGEHADWTGRVTPLRAEFKYLADPEARFAVEYEGMELADTLPYSTERWGLQYVSKSSVYVKESQMSGMLRVYRLGDGERTLDMEESVNISPVVVVRADNYSTVNLLQLAAGSPVEVMHTPETPADSSAIALQLFYGDARQPDEVKISLLAVDQYSLMTKSYKLDNVPDTMKAAVGEIALRRGELSETVTLNLNQFGEANRGLEAKFYYRVSGSDGAVLQDYRAASSAANSAEIKVEVPSQKRTRPVYRSAVMQWEYKSAAVPFASPKVLMNGEKW
jgi:hypothetical protein